MAYKRSPVTSEKAPPPLGAYSQGIRAGFDRQQILLSGTIPLRHDPATGKTELVNGTIEEQAVQVFTNMKCKFSNIMIHKFRFTYSDYRSLWKCS